MSRFGRVAFTWILIATLWGNLSAVLAGINDSASSNNLKPETEVPSRSPSFKLSILTNSTMKVAWHTTQVKGNEASKIIAHSSDVSGIQTSYITQKLLYSIRSPTATPQIKTSYLPQARSSRDSYDLTVGGADNSFSTELLSSLTSGIVSLSSTQKMATTSSIDLQSSSFILNLSLSQTITKTSTSVYHSINSETILSQATSTVVVNHTLNPRLTPPGSVTPLYTRIVSSQSLSQNSATFVSQQQEINSTLVVTTASLGPLSDNQNTRNNFKNTESLQATISRGNLAETTSSSFQDKESKGSIAGTPIPGVTMHQTVRNNKSFSLNFTATKTAITLKTSSKVSSLTDLVTMGSESFQTSSRTVFFVPKTTPKIQTITSYNTSNIHNTINLVYTSKLVNQVTQGMTVSASLRRSTIPFYQNNTSIHVVNTPSTFSSVNASFLRACHNSTMCPSHLITQSKTILTQTIVSPRRATNTFLISKLNKTQDGMSMSMSEVSVTDSSSSKTVLSLSTATNRTSVNQITASHGISKTTDISQDFHATVLTSSLHDSATEAASTLLQHNRSMIKIATSKPMTIFLEVNTSSLSYSNGSGSNAASLMSSNAVKKSTHIKTPVSNNEHSKQEIGTKYMTPTKTISAFSSSVEASGKRVDTSSIEIVTGKKHSTHIVDVVVPDTTNMISTSYIKPTVNVSNLSRSTPMPTGTSTSLTKVFMTTSSIIDPSDSLLRHGPHTLTPALSTLSFIVSSGNSRSSGSTVPKLSHVVPVAASHTTSPVTDYLTKVVPSSSTEHESISPSGSNTIPQKTYAVSSPNETNVGDIVALPTSSVQYISSKSRGVDMLSISSESFIRHSLQKSSTLTTVNIMHSNKSHTGHPSILYSTTLLLNSSSALHSKAINSTRDLSSITSSTQAIPTLLMTLPRTTSLETSHNLATSGKYATKQSSKRVSMELPTMASTNQRLSVMVTSPRLHKSSEERTRSSSTFIERPFTTHYSVNSLPLLNSSAASTSVFTRKMTTSAKMTPSSDFTFGLSSITKDLQTQSGLASSSYVSKGDSAASFLHASFMSSNETGSESTSATTLNLDTSQKNTMVSQFSATGLHRIKSTKQTFGSENTNTLPGYSRQLTFSSRKKHTVDSVKTQTSPVPRTALSFTRRTSSIAPDATVTHTTKTVAPVSSASASAQTQPPLEIPRQFEGRMILEMPWKPEYEYPPQSQTLATTITKKLINVLKIFPGFISVQVLRLWKSSVGVDFIVYVSKGAQVNESVVERTLIEANRTGILNLPLTSLQVKEKEATTTPSPATTSSTDDHKSIERWIIILIVAGILVFLLSLIICILVTKLTKQKGGLRRSGKYELASFNNLLYSERTESGAKPVILRMEERKRDARGSRITRGLYDVYGSTNSNSVESLSHNEGGGTPTEDHTYYSISEYRNSHKDSTTVPTITAESAKDVQEDPGKVSIPPNKSTMSSKESADKSNYGYRNSHEDLNSSMTVESQLSENKHNFEDPVAPNTCANGNTGGSNEATSSSCTAQNEERQQVRESIHYV